MEIIRLRKGEWRYDPNDQLGLEGGFGAVFRGISGEGSPVAVKRLKVSAGDAGHRELAIADALTGKTYSNVLPIFDSGVDADSGRYFVVMALAGGALKAYIPATGLNESEAIGILSQVANGLEEVKDIIVHRDLKPPNILFHEGVWKIADFGIARFIEESTSMRTLKECLSPLYAAPEQWRLERST